MKAITLYTGDFLTIQEDEAAVRENISRILITRPGERVNNPNFGSKVREFLFAIDVVMQEEIESEIARAVNRWEPRVQITNVSTERKNENTFIVNISGAFKDTLEPFTYEQLIRL